MFSTRETTNGTTSSADLTNAKYVSSITKVGDKFLLYFVTDKDMIEIRLNEEQLKGLVCSSQRAAEYWTDIEIPYHV